MMIQPFLDSIVEKGEISLIVIDGKYTHAVLKKVKFGDFRVQDDFGGTVHPYEATPEEIAIAEKAVAACPYHPLYARVDLVWDQNDELAVSELELIEPELFFRNRPEAAVLLAKAIAKYID
jgi:glutathione synthase/RimK-type ligase-like ATP-grasp enzyme